MAQAEVDAARREETVCQNMTQSATAWIDRVEKDPSLRILFIEGQAGLGKSSMCKYLGREQCVSAGRIVLVVELPVLQRHLGTGCKHVTRELALSVALAGKFDDAPQRREFILSTPILWVLDGFDEVSSTKDSIAKLGLQNFINACFAPDPSSDFRFKDDMVLLTSRKERGCDINIYRPLEAALKTGRALHLVLRKWNRYEIDEFVVSVFAARRTHCQDQGLDEKWIDEAQRAARVAATAPGLHTWEGVPLMYDILCTYIADTYHEDFLRQGVQGVELFDITPETLIREAIERVYAREVKKGRDTPGAEPLVAFEEAQVGAQKYAFNKLAFSFKEKLKNRNEAMEYTLSRLGWFVKVTDATGTSYRFAHKSFAEYFRALSIYDQLDTPTDCTMAMTSTEEREVSDVTVSLLVHRLKRELKAAKERKDVEQIEQKISNLVSFTTDSLWRDYFELRKDIARELAPLSRPETKGADPTNAGKIRDTYSAYEKWRKALQMNIAVEVCAVLDKPDELLRYRGLKPFASIFAQYFYLLLLLPAARHGHFQLVRKTADIFVEYHGSEIRPGLSVLPSQALVQVAETLARLPKFQGNDRKLARLSKMFVKTDAVGSTGSLHSSPTSPFESLWSALRRPFETRGSGDDEKPHSRESQLEAMIKYLKEKLHAEVTTMEICRAGCFLLLEEQLKGLLSPAIAYLPEGKARLDAFRAEAFGLLKISLANEHRECASYISRIMNIHGTLLSIREFENLAQQAAKQNVHLNVDVTGDASVAKLALLVHLSSVSVVRPSIDSGLGAHRIKDQQWKRLMPLLDTKHLECFAAHDCDFHAGPTTSGPTPLEFLRSIVESSPLRRIELHHCIAPADHALTLPATVSVVELHHWRSTPLQLSRCDQLEAFVTRHSVLSSMLSTVVAKSAHSLKVLDLAGSLKTGENVSTLEKAQWLSLQYVDLSSTAATDACLQSIRCSSLQHLDISDTGGRVTGESIEEIARHCSSLRHLNVSNTEGRVSDASITEVAKHCTSLQHLDVSATYGMITDVSITEVARRCPSLHHLNVSATVGRVTDISITEVANHCPSLQHLNVGTTDCKVTDASITDIAKHCPSLQHLDISNTVGITDASIAKIAKHCPSLQHLNVRWTDGVTDASIAEIAKRCGSLQHLDVSDTRGKVTDASLVEIVKHCNSLQHLNVSSTKGMVTDVSITELAKRCTSLHHLDVSLTEGMVTDASVTEIAKCCTLLQHLNVSAADGKVTDASIVEVAKHCPSLHHLNVSNTRGKTTDASIAEIAKRCPALHHLDVSSTEGMVTDASIIEIAKRCGSLQRLDVRNTGGKVTDASIIEIANQCKSLQCLNVSSTKGMVTDVSITELAKRCTSLNHLDVSATEGMVTDASITLILKHCPSLQRLDVRSTEGKVTNVSLRWLPASVRCARG